MYLFTHSIPAWLEHLSLSLWVGILVCRLWVLPPAHNELQRKKDFPARMWFFFGISIVVMLASSVADLFVGASEMSGKSILDVFLLVPSVIFRTHLGLVWLVRIVCLVLVIVVITAAFRLRDKPAVLFFLLCIGTLVAATESATGHASDTGDFTIREMMDWFHLLGALVWGGGLFVLSTLILPDMIKQGYESREALAGVVRRFSKIAGIAVAIILLTAIYHAWVYVGSFEALLISPYGKTVAAKSILLLFLLLLAAFNRYISVPILQEQAGYMSTRQSVIRRLVIFVLSLFTGNLKRRSISIFFLHIVRSEAVIMILLLFCAALLRHEVPARHFAHMEHTQSGGHVDHEAHMQLAANPDFAKARIDTNPATITAGTPVSMMVHIEDIKKQPFHGLLIHHERILHPVIIGKDLKVFAHIHPEDLGRLTEEMKDKATFPLRYIFPKAGSYVMGIDFVTDEGLYNKSIYLTAFGKPTMQGSVIDLSRSNSFGHYKVTLTTSPRHLKAREGCTLTYMIEREGKPVKDFQPYLGAAMHMAVVRIDLTH